MSRLVNRRPAEHYKLTLLGDKPREGAPGQHAPGHRIHVTVGRDLATGAVTELFFVGRGKSGHGLDDLLTELGVKLSRIMQGRDPETGEDLG